VVGIVVLILIGVVAAGYLFIRSISQPSDTSTRPTISTTPSGQPKASRIHVAAMGDMLAHDTIIANAKTSTGYDFSKYFANIRSSYDDSDMVFCNQEGLSAGEAYGISGYPSFNAPSQFSADLQSGAGCNLINLANNHMGDKGVAATNATIDVWNKLKPLGMSGANKSVADQNKVSYAELNGIKLGFVSFADFNNNKETPGYSINIYHDEALVRRLVGEARANADVVLVSMHWGVEYASDVSDDQQDAVELLSSLGVDVVIGTGPHVLQKVETVSRKDGDKMVVWYSLGNMLSSQLEIQHLIGGIAQFDIVKTKDRQVSIDNLSFTPTYMHYEWTAEEKARGDLLARKNAMVYLLKDAAGPLSRSQFHTTVAAQQEYVTSILGSNITIK
jgi:poly-gamma-glutamate synthesis protein (capsule biosynthesis protein)